MEKTVKSHLRKIQVSAWMSLFAITVSCISFGIGALFLYYIIRDSITQYIYVTVICFAIFLCCIVCLMIRDRIIKKTIRSKKYNPVKLNFEKEMSFAEIISQVSALTNSDNTFSLSDNIYFFKFKRKVETRLILYKTSEFNNREFKYTKKQVNHKANKLYNVSQENSQNKAPKRMRLNVIYTDNLNEETEELTNRNALYNLKRREGSINIVIYNNTVIIPPLYGNCDVLAVNRYKEIIKFILHL